MRDDDVRWRIDAGELDRNHGKLRRAAAPMLNKIPAYAFRHTAVSNHHERGQDLGIWGDKLCFEDNHDPINSLGFYQRHLRELREFIDRYPREVIDFCEAWIFESLKMFLRRPYELRHICAAAVLGSILGWTQVRIIMQEYRSRKRDLPSSETGKKLWEKTKNSKAGNFITDLGLLFQTLEKRESIHD